MKRLSVSLVALLAIPALAFAAASQQESKTSSTAPSVKEAPLQTQTQGEEANPSLICSPVPIPVRICAQNNCSGCKTQGECTAQAGCIWTGNSCT